MKNQGDSRVATSNGVSRRTALATAASAVGVAACAGAPQSVSAAMDGHATQSRGAGLSRFTLNLETWWRPAPLDKRIDLAARAGFTTAEMWNLGEGERNPTLLRQQSREAAIQIIHCTVDVPAQMAAATPAQVRESVIASLDNITTLGARYATIVGHQSVDGMAKWEMLAAYQDHIAAIAPLFEAANVTLCIEPFNRFNHPGFFIYGAEDAVKICRAVDSPNVQINWDLFHMQRHEGNVVHHLREGFDHIGLLQIADSPDRREPGTGEMNYAYILKEAMALGYDGPIGLECFPVRGEEARALENVRALAAAL